MPVRLASGFEKNLERRLAAEQVGDLRFDAFTRGRYSTDASHYQIVPLVWSRRARRPKRNVRSLFAAPKVYR